MRFRIGSNAASRDMIIISTVALVFSLVAVPFIIHILFELERSSDHGPSYSNLGANDFKNVTIEWEGHTENTTIFGDSEFFQGNFVSQDVVVWNNSGALNILSVSGSNIYVITFITNIRLNDMIEDDRLSLRIQVNNSKLRSCIPAFYPFENGVLDLDEAGYSLGEKTLGNNTVYWNMSTLDLLEGRAAVGDEALLIISLVVGIVDYELNYWEPGDQIIFHFQVLEADSNFWTQERILKLGSAVMGIVLLIMALAATPHFNPGQPYNKGIVDKILAKIPVIGRWFKGLITKENAKKTYKYYNKYSKYRRGRY